MAKPVKAFRPEGGGWRVKITTAGGQEFFSQEQLQPHRGRDSYQAKYLIRFHFPFDISSDSNIGDIWIYNVRKETIEAFKRGDLVKVEVAYQPFEKHRELLMEGTIEDVLVDEVDKATRMLHVKIGDTTDIWPVVVTTKQYGPGTKASVIAHDLIDELGLPIGKFSPKEDPTYTKGLSLVGAVRPELEMVVRDMKSKLHISRRQVYVTMPDQGVPSGVVLNPDNGLLAAKPTLAIAEDMQYIAAITGEEHPYLYEIRALLAPKLWSDSEFTVESDDLSGRFRALRGSHDCDGRNFLTRVWAVKI